MKTSRLLCAILLAGVLFAGCTGSGEAPALGPVTDRPELKADRGAIAGLLVDDIFRPVPQALILLQGAGLTTETDDLGQFRFLDILPGSYVAIASAPNHEAAPVNVDVVAGEYTDLEVSARRLFSNDGYVITTQYSIFSACATSTGVISLLSSCLADSDSARYGLHIKNFTMDNITYLVSEVRLNQADNYAWVLRCSGGGSFGCGEYAYVNITTADETSRGVYGKAILKLNDNYMKTWQSHPWNNTDPMDMLVFYMGQGGREITGGVKPAGCAVTDAWNGLPDPVPSFPTNPLNDKPIVCREYYGVGHRFAVQGRIIMSLFLGEPTTPIEDYHVLSAD